MIKKKCSSCGTWNDGSSSTCSACDELLDLRKKEYERLKKLGKLPIEAKEHILFEIKPEYPVWRKTVLYIIRPVYWLFVIVSGFFLWLAAWVSA
ncbi:MAG: hypothetical protein P8O07_09305 [Crocinitomicaceae bacterium]|nr:hypothetical protein [Crocinitomicaceae bacterium]